MSQVYSLQKNSRNFKKQDIAGGSSIVFIRYTKLVMTYIEANGKNMWAFCRILYILMYSGIPIKRTPYKANISVRWTVTPFTDVFTVKLLYTNFYKADSQNTITFFIY